MKETKDKQSILISSEKLTDLNEDWCKVPQNHFVVVSMKLKVSVFPVGV